ncbi:MAG: hypothetical protein AABY83_15095 [Pseudomonadota bacterium]
MAKNVNTGWIVAVASLLSVVIVLAGVVIYLLPAKHATQTVHNETKAAPKPAQPKVAAKDDRFVEGAIVGGILGSVVTHVIDNNHRPSGVVVVDRGGRPHHRD